MLKHLLKHSWILLSVSLFAFNLSAQSYSMNGNLITDCNGFFYDSGGQNSTYGLNENFTTTICSDNSTGTNIQLFFSGIDIGSGETIQFYDADTADPAFLFDSGFLTNPSSPFTIQASAANPSGCITVVFTSDGIDESNIGWSADINCVANCQVIQSVLASSSPAVSPVDTGYIDICPGDRVTLNGEGFYPQNGIQYQHSDFTSSFEWDFGDGNTAVGPNVTHVYEESGGYYIQLTITDQFGCKNTNFLNQRVRVAPLPTYNFQGTLDPTLCSGDTIMVTSSVDPNSGSDVVVQPNPGDFQPPSVRSDTILLPDGTGSFYESSISINQFNPGAVLTNPNDLCAVSLNLEHSYSGDLDIELICPDGTSISILTYGSGLGSTNFGEPFASGPVDGTANSADTTTGIPYTYIFTTGGVNGTLSQFAPSAPNYPGGGYTTVPSNITGQTFTYNDSYFPAGEYQPQESFNNLLGCPLNGSWTIRVTDNLNLDNGWLTGWGIEFKPYLYADIEVFTPQFVDWNWDTNPTVISSSPDSILASPVNAGLAAYTFWVEDSFGCVNDTTLNFEILPPTHPDCYECLMEVNDQEDIVLCEGETAILDVRPSIDLNQEITFERFPQYPIGNANHPPGNAYQSILPVNSIRPDIITNPFTQIESVCFSLTTDFIADMNISLVAPNGIVLPLSLANGGGSPDGYINTCFTPDAPTSINAGSPPFTGEYQPEGDWSILIGTPVNGDWTLQITDQFGPLQFGEFLEWSITFNNENEYDYQWSPSTGLSDPNSPTPEANPSTTTVYELLVTDAYNCSLLDTVSVSVIADIPVPVVSCEDLEESILFTWPSIPGITEYEYNVTLPSGPQGWVGPITDTEVLVSNLNNGDIVFIEVRAFLDLGGADCEVPIGTASCTSSFCGLEIADADVTDLSCFGLDDGSLNVNIVAGEAPYSVTINETGQTSMDVLFTDLAAGDYTYTVRDAQDCEITASFTILSPDSLFANATQTFLSCADLDEGTVEVIAGGGTGTNYSYAWNNGQITNVATDLTPGNYEVTVTDEQGCTTAATTIVEELAPIDFNLIVENPSCNGYNDGGAGVNQISGGTGLIETDYTFLWEDGSTEIVRTDVLGDMLISVTVTDAQGCFGILERQINDPLPVTYSIVNSDPSCFAFSDGWAEVTNISSPNGGPYDINWDNAAGNQITARANSLTTGIYSVTVTDTEGCEAIESTNLSQPEQLLLEYSAKDVECFGYSNGSITLNAIGGSAPYTYSWPDGNNLTYREGLIAGNYNIMVTDSKDCEASVIATLDQPVELIANIDAQAVSCFGERDGRIEINVEGGTPPFNYSLDNDNFTTSNVLIGLHGGDYNLFIRDVNDCQFLTNTTVPEPAEFMVDAGPDWSMIYGENVELTAATSNAQGEVEFVWQAPYEGTLSCSECPKSIASPEFTIDYEVYAIDENGCEDTDMIRVLVDKPKLAVVPSGFTPNADNMNDLLQVHGRPGTLVELFQVFDRWGELVYEEAGFPVNEPNIGWDGNFRDKPMNSGVFVWFLSVIHEDGTQEGLRGQTMLIR